MMTQKSESDIINETLLGNVESFSLIIESYQDVLGAYILTQSRNREDAEDILQETFINAYKYLKSYNSQWKFKTWLFTIARRILFKYYQAIKTIEFQDSEVHENINEDFLELKNIWTVIKKTVNPITFEILWFYYSEELSIKEIAKILNCSQGKVKMYLFRCKRKLAKNKEIESLFNDLIMVG